MFEDLKKKSLKSSLPISIILIIAGLALAGWHAVNLWYIIAGYADFEQLAPDQIRNQLVDVELTANFGCFLEISERNTEHNTQKTTDLYYVIWTGGDYATDYRYMALRVPPSYRKTLNAMADNTYNQILSDPALLSGKVKKLRGKYYTYFKEYFIDSGFTDKEFEESTIPYYIDCGDKKNMNIGYSVLFSIGLVTLAAGLIRIIKGLSGGYVKKLYEDISNAGYSESVIEADYAAAEPFDKKEETKMGKLMTYYTSGATVRAIPNNKIVWAYQNTVTHRTNGVKTGTTYNVVFFVEGYKNEITLSVPDEATAQKMLQRTDSMFPWVIVGYSDELKKMYKSDRDQFLKLRYNTCEHIPAEPDIYGRTPIQPY